MNTNNKHAKYHVLSLAPSFYHQILDIAGICALHSEKACSKMVIVKATNHTSCAESESGFLLLYGIAWSTTSSNTLTAAELLRKRDSGYAAIEGQFIIVEWDKPKQKLSIITDYFGSRSIYFYSNNDSLIVAQEGAVLRTVLADSAAISEEAFATSLGGIEPAPSPARPTLLKNVQRLCGNCLLELSNNNLHFRNVRGPIRPHLESLIVESQHPGKDLFAELKDAIIASTDRLRKLDADIALDLSGGLDSGVLLATILARGKPPTAINSLVSPNILVIENRNIGNWSRISEQPINRIDLGAPENALSDTTRHQHHLDVSGIGAIHIEALAAAAPRGSIRIIGYGPDEFMTHPLSFHGFRTICSALFVQRNKRALLSEIYRRTSHSTLPITLRQRLCERTVPPWFEGRVRKQHIHQKLALQEYERSIDYLGQVGNRQYKIEFYQSRNLQLALNDEISLKRDVFCYYPYLDEQIQIPAHMLAIQRGLSTSADYKYAFRKLMNDMLPDFLGSGSAENENFSIYNQLANESLALQLNPKSLLSIDQGYINKSRFNDYLAQNRIPATVLARLHLHDAFLATL